ncbi:MAG: hypothetical protein OXT09_21600 [Myxococcales bacterium]|nr:hypothetical protein [Myxococcales bacterium]
MRRQSPRRTRPAADPGPHRAARLWLAALLWALASTGARAQSDGEPLTESDFNIDFVVGPILGAGRIIGLGGAYTALATGVDGTRWNPATYASRDQWALDWLEWDVAFGLIPGSLRNTDFDNDGDSGFEYDSFIFLTLGLGFQFGELGVGGAVTTQSYEIGGGTNLSLTVGNWGGGYAFLKGQLVLGLSARTVSLTITEGADQPLVDFNGTGPEAGAVLRLSDEPWRIGLAARLPVESDRADTPVASGFVLPQQVRLPWEIQLGAAWQIGPRPLNGAWVNPNLERVYAERAMHAARRARLKEQLEREELDRRVDLAAGSAPPRVAHLSPRVAPPRHSGDLPQDPSWWEEEKDRRLREERELRAQLEEDALERRRNLRAMSRRYLLMSAETILVGPTDSGIGVESFLTQVRRGSGQDLSFGFRFGVEGEPIAQYVKMRAGSYFEPSRFEGVPYRVHGTIGTDIRLFSWDLFGLLDEFTLSLGGSADVAERYVNLGVGIGLWH